MSRLTYAVELKKTSYNWANSAGTYVCGYLFVKDILYRGSDLAEYIDSSQDVLSIVNNANGEFCIIKTDGKSLAAYSDVIRSYPLFYTVFHDKLFLTDTAETLVECSNAKINPVFKKEYLAAGFVSGSYTLFDGIYTIQAGEFLFVETEKESPKLTSYYQYDTAPLSKLSENQLIAQLECVTNNVFDRLVRTLDGRQIVVPLSGGFDSRLVVQMLHKRGVSNVVCFSYGRKNSKECIYSKQIADSLGYRWIYVDLTLSRWRKIFKQPHAKKYLYNYDNISAIPYIQHYASMSILLDGDFGIKKNCIVITGNSGDFLEGKNIHNDVFQRKIYSHDEVAYHIALQHDILAGIEPLMDSEILSAIRHSIPDCEKFTADETVRISERFNWRERQSKYVVADSRVYEALGVGWRLPLWDKELVCFWESVPPEIRAERGLYYKYVSNEEIGNANDPTAFQIATLFLKNKSPHLLNVLFYFKRAGEYFSHPLHWYGIVSFLTYMRSVMKTNGASGFSICTIVAQELCDWYTKFGATNDL